jgi:hypothetical protein
VCLALVQVGLLVRDQLVLVGAARAGAREAAVTDREDEVREAVEQAATTLDPNRVQVSVNREGGQGDPVTVELAYTAEVLVPFVDWLFPSEVEMAARAIMRQEFA